MATATPDEMPDLILVYRTPTVLQMGPINIQVNFFAIFHFVVTYILLSSILSVPFKSIILCRGKDPCQ